MAKRSVTLEKSTAFAKNNKPVSNVRRGHSNRGRTISTSTKLSNMDELLEDTLINNHITTAKLLSRREAEVLQLIISGKTNKEIARLLYRTERTIEYNRSHLMRKLGAHNAAELVKRAIAMGIVS